MSYTPLPPFSLRGDFLLKCSTILKDHIYNKPEWMSAIHIFDEEFADGTMYRNYVSTDARILINMREKINEKPVLANGITIGIAGKKAHISKFKNTRRRKFKDIDSRYFICDDVAFKKIHNYPTAWGDAFLQPGGEFKIADEWVAIDIKHLEFLNKYFMQFSYISPLKVGEDRYQWQDNDTRIVLMSNSMKKYDDEMLQREIKILKSWERKK
jgi:hypothetical protein